MTGRSGRIGATDAGLAPIATPTLILQGEEDNLVPAEHGKKFNAAINGSELKLYANVGHLPQEEAAEQSLADLRAFLSEKVYVPVETVEPEEVPAE